MKKFINVINIYTILNIFKNRTFKATNFESFEKKMILVLITIENIKIVKIVNLSINS